MTTPVFVNLKRNISAKVYVIPDIHGYYKTLVSLLDTINLQPDDLLIFLGDYIDRGPESKKVLDLVMGMKNQNPNVYALRGNHENTILELNEDEERFLHWHLRKNKMEDILEKGRIKRKYTDFINSLPYYIEVDNFLLVHAGFDFTKYNPFEDLSSMLWLRDFKTGFDQTKGKQIIHGHDPKELTCIQEAISDRAAAIPLDNGVAYHKKHKIYDHNAMGNLCCLELISMTLTVQKNID